MSHTEQSQNNLVVAAERGDADAMCRLGISCIGKDNTQAVKWLAKAAEANHPNAMDLLAMMYADGMGVARDDRVAAKWARRAAEAGNVAAMQRLAGFLREGRGVARDEAEADKWLAAWKSRQMPMGDAIEGAICKFYDVLGVSPSGFARMGAFAILPPLIVVLAVCAFGLWLILRLW